MQPPRSGARKTHFALVLFYPVISLVFFVGEHSGGRFFAEASRDGEAAGAGTDYDYIVYFGVCGHLDCSLWCWWLKKKRGRDVVDIMVVFISDYCC